MKYSMYPCIWFNGNAREAADFYGTAFGKCSIMADTPMVVIFSLGGQKFMGLNGGPKFKPNPSVSFYVVCETEQEIDLAWTRLNEGGQVLMPLDKYPWSTKYGWVSDKFGVSWQLSLDKMENVGQKFTPLFMFTGSQSGKAEQAIQFYTSVFIPSSVQGIARYEPGEPDVTGFIKHAQFRLGENLYMAMDSSMPHGFTFTEGISIVVECDSQKGIDYFWDSLSKGGEESQCGWLEDPFGVSWQIIPSNMGQLMSGDPARAGRVMQALLKMKKIDIDKLASA